MRSPLLAGSLAGLAVLLAACGGGATPAATEAPAATVAPATAAPAATDAPAADTVQVALADTSLGSVLTGAGGMTLYVFVPDNGGASTCYDACAQSWPPLLGDATPGSGLDAEDFGTTARDDGTMQATFYGWPLYYFAGDKAAGDVNGQGLNDKWYVVDGSGAMVGAPAATEAPAADTLQVDLADTSLGSVLVDGNGMTLYMFTADSGGSSTCYDSCAQSWPPLLGTVEAGSGLAAGDFGTTSRTDGSAQATFHGMPLYLFAGDKAAGDVNGQGVGGKWFVLGADGTPIE